MLHVRLGLVHHVVLDNDTSISNASLSTKAGLDVMSSTSYAWNVDSIPVGSTKGTSFSCTQGSFPSTLETLESYLDENLSEATIQGPSRTIPSQDVVDLLRSSFDAFPLLPVHVLRKGYVFVRRCFACVEHVLPMFVGRPRESNLEAYK